MMKTGRYWKDQGIVLKSINFGELDRIVTLFTRKKGKINVIAKGARKVGNRFGPALDCPAISNFMFFIMVEKCRFFLKRKLWIVIEKSARNQQCFCQ